MDRLSLSTRKNPNVFEKLLGGNLFLLIPVIVISIMGTLTLYSAAGGNFEPWANKQIMRLFTGMIILLIVAAVDLRFWMEYAYIFYIGCLLLLIIVEVKGYIGMGAQRWIDLKFIRIQPAELMKISIVLSLARFFHLSSINQLSNPLYLLIPAGMVILPALLILIQPDLGTAGLILMIGTILFIISAIPRWIIISAFIMGLGALPLLWNVMHEYQRRRIFSFLNPENDPLGAGYHSIQSKIALGSGGLWGKGFLQGTQSHLNFLPEKQTDFIFAMFCEEFGFIGGIFLLSMYITFIVTGYIIAIRSQNYFGKLVGIGVVGMIFCYMTINTAMVIGLFPVVGVPLPLMSYGGASMFTMLIGCGLLMSVAVHKKQKLYAPD